MTKARIVVADDSESSRYVLAAWLRRAGYDVVEAGTGEEALQVVAAEPVDLVVLDVNMPDISGYVVCERLKSAPLTASLPVLHVSATATEASDRSEGLRRGADGYLVQPLERDELLASVEALLRGAAAHRTALRLARRLRRLNDATLAVNEAATLDVLVRTIAAQAASLFEAHAIAVIDVQAVAIAAVAVPGRDVQVAPADFGVVDAVRAATGAGTRVSATALDGLAGVDAAAASFLVGDLGGPPGGCDVLLVDASDDESELVLTQFARAAANAIKNVRTFDIERRIALTLQHSLLPGVLPTIPALDVAVRYEASAEHAEVGGDFYELFRLGDERVAFAIGDVVGHSLEAATVMAELRTAIRSYSLEGHEPAAMLERLNALLLHFHPGLTATVCIALLDLASGICAIANAGHPPPLLLERDGASFLPLGGALLGVDVPPAPPHVFTLESGDVLVLYTDGLIERRYEHIDAGFRRLAAVAFVRGEDLRAYCDRLLLEVGPKERLDDVALVAIRRTSD